MSIDNDELSFNKALLDRVRGIRAAKGWSAEEMAMALGIPAERYRKYEKRSPIPHYLIPRLALISGRSAEWILTGKETRASGKVRRGQE